MEISQSIFCIFFFFFALWKRLRCRTISKSDIYGEECLIEAEPTCNPMIGLHMSRKQCQCPFTSFNFGDFAFENVTSFECQIRIVDDKIKKAKR